MPSYLKGTERSKQMLKENMSRLRTIGGRRREWNGEIWSSHCVARTSQVILVCFRDALMENYLGRLLNDVDLDL